MKHGLASPIEKDPAFADRIEAIATELGRTMLAAPDQIRLAALGHAEMERVQELWAKLMESGINAIGGDGQGLDAAESALRRLQSLSRYERRAASRLRKMPTTGGP